MPYEDDYKMWLEKMLIESNPDWVCDGMYDMGFTHEWCEKYCGEDSEYVTPKCLHMYYHHIVKAGRKTEPTISKMEQVEDEPQTDEEYINNLPWTEKDCKACELDGKADVCKICRVSNYEPQTDCPWK